MYWFMHHGVTGRAFNALWWLTGGGIAIELYKREAKIDGRHRQ